MNIEKAKKQAESLAAYLKTVGKNLKHTHALEAVARIQGFRSWNTFCAQLTPKEATSASPADVLFCLLTSSALSYVSLDGERFEVSSFESAISEDASETCVELFRIDDTGLVWDVTITAGELKAAVPLRSGGWRLPDGSLLVAFKEEQIAHPAGLRLH